MNEEWIDVRIQLKDAARYVAQATEAGAATSKLGTEAEVAGAKAAQGGRGFGLFNRGMVKSTDKGILGRLKGIGGSYFHAAKGIAAAGAAFVGYEGAKKAVENTDTLAQSTLRLTKNTAFDVQTASRWSAVAMARGIDANRLGQTLAKLSKTVEGGIHGQKASVATWQQLGITTSDLIKSQKDMPGFLGLLADRLHMMGAGTERTALAQQLFGRSWQTLIPMLRDGSGALNKQLDLAGKYGAQFSEGGLGSVENFIRKQREMKFATLGLQISFALFLIPAIVKLIGWFNHLVLWLRNNHNATSVLTGTFHAFGAVLGFIAHLIGSNAVASRVLGVALTALIALAIATKVLKWVTALRETATTLRIVTAAQWLWNVAMDANPIFLIITAIVLLGTVLVLAYKKVGWFRTAVNAAWGAIKTAFMAVVHFIGAHWGLLLIVMTGGLAAPVVFIIKNWKKIKSAASDAAHGISSAWHWAIGGIVGLFHKAENIGKSMWNGVVAGGKGAINAIISVFNFGIDAINQITPGDIKIAGHTIIPGIPDIPKIPLLAEGGIVRLPGMAVVGEQGPELLSMPTGARVDPLPASRPTTAQEPISNRLAKAAARHLNLTIPVMVSGKEIGRAQSKYVDNELARGKGI